MKETRIEPGLLQVFRWYAALRVLLLLISPLRILLEYPRYRPIQPEDYFHIIYPDMGLVLGEMLVLLMYLNWSWLQRKLGSAYLPIALVIAIVGPIYEQETFSMAISIWQPGPFLTIPILLAAWQYNFRIVALFILGSALLEIGLSIIFPSKIFFFSGAERVPRSLIIYGRLISRSVSSLILGFIVTRLMNSQRKQHQELAAANKKLVQHTATLEQLTVSRERNRLSRELHDTLAHTLSALTVQLEAVTTVWKRIPKKARGMLDQMLTSTREGLDNTRRALKALRAAPLEELGLAQAIKSMAEEVAVRNKLELDDRIAAKITGISPELEQCYYRVAQEALQNAAQHAGASSLTVSLEQKGGAVTLAVADDGSGFDQKDIPEDERLGLTGMRERAELVEAEFSVDSDSGKGTTVRLVYQEGA